MVQPPHTCAMCVSEGGLLLQDVLEVCGWLPRLVLMSGGEPSKLRHLSE